MITINLLRRTLVHEQRQRRQNLIEAATLLFVIVGTVMTCGFVWVDLDRSREKLYEEKAYKTAQLEQRDRTSDQMEMIHHHNEDMRTRYQSITYLMEQQQRSVRLLDTVSRSLDPLDIWLSKLDMRQDRVTLEGYAGSKSHIVQFAQYLKQDGVFQEVRVLEAGKTSGESFGYQFMINLLLMSEMDHVTSS